VTLSSGEAEFHGVVKGCGMALGCQSLLRDLGVEVPVRVWTDSSAALGICTRQGLGKLRHLDTHLLWVQQAVRQKRVELRKVPGTANPADLFAKHSLSRERLANLVSLYDCYYSSGRAASAPELRREHGSKKTMADADSHLQCEAFLTDHGEDPDEEAGATILPHTCFQLQELDRRYPAIHVTDDTQTCLTEPYVADPLLAEGERIAQQVKEQTQWFGRTAKVVMLTSGADDSCGRPTSG